MNLVEWIIEYIHLAYLQLRSLFVRGGSKMLNQQKPVCILIPGLYERWSALQFLAKHIEKQGMQVICIPELGYMRSSVESLAQIVANYIQEHDLRSVVIIAHSKGGLVGQYVLRELNEGNRVKHLIGIAVPWNGTAIGAYLHLKSLKELGSESPIMQSLARQHNSDKDITAILAQADNHIWDQPLERPTAENIVLPVKGHTYILFSKELEKVLSRILEKLKF